MTPLERQRLEEILKIIDSSAKLLEGIKAMCGELLLKEEPEQEE